MGPFVFMDHNSKENLRKKLEEDFYEAPFSELLKHAHFGSLIEVKELNLIEVGLAIATDDIENVKQWLQSSQIVKCDTERQKILGDNPEAVYNFIIIQPYILFKYKEEIGKQ